jgi:hypothetical protein
MKSHLVRRAFDMIEEISTRENREVKDQFPPFFGNGWQHAKTYLSSQNCLEGCGQLLLRDGPLQFVLLGVPLNHVFGG